MSNNFAPPSEAENKIADAASSHVDSPLLTSPSPQVKSPKDALEKLTLGDGDVPSSGSTSNSVWNFSSWGASLVSSVTSTAEKIGGTVSKVTSNYIEDVYATLDPEYKSSKIPNTHQAEKSTESNETSSKNEPSSETESTSPSRQTPKITKVAGETAEAMLSTIDKTFDFASGLLGNAVMSGYNVISNEASKITKSLESYREGASTDSKSPVFAHSKEIASNFATQSVDALEEFGKRAINIITPNIPKREAAPNTDSGSPEHSYLLPSFSTHFENHGGSAHLSALEMLSDEAQLKLTVSPLYNSPEFTEISSKLDSCVAVDEFLDELDEAKELNYQNITTSMAASLEKLGMHSSLASIQMNELNENLKKTIEDNSSGEVVSPSAAFARGVEGFSKMTTDLCEQVLRVSEIYLLAITDLKNAENSDDAAFAFQAFRNLIESHYQILQHFYNQYTSSLESEMNLLNEWSEAKTIAFGNVHDAMHSLLSVLKLYSIKVFERESNATTKNSSLQVVSDLNSD